MLFPNITITPVKSWLIFTIFWSLLMFLLGNYKGFVNKELMSHLHILVTTLFVGLIFFFFLFLIKSSEVDNTGFFHLFFYLYSILFCLLMIPRLVFSLTLKHLMSKKKIAIHAIMVGNSEKAMKILTELKSTHQPNTYHIKGYIATEAHNINHLPESIPCLGELNHLDSIINQLLVDEVFVAIDSSQTTHILKVLTILKQKGITIRLYPDLNQILEGTVKMNNIKSIPLITIKNDLMPVWQLALKTATDYFVSILALILALPLIPLIIIGIKASSKGPVLYIQTRAGKHRKPFKMLKFRSMYTEAEQHGPALSSHNDPRITPFGKIMRKWHLDEIPQFINVLAGHMSLVGPRPEREYYIEKILTTAPHYIHLFRTKPGITSWGMVKYGYAENVPQMLERLQYDMLYLENMSLLVDLKIIIYTLKTIFKGNGK